MQYGYFLIGSVAEYIGLFIFMFTLFRFTLDRRFVKIVIALALLTTQISYFTRLSPEIGNLSTYIQFAFFVIALRVLFRVTFFHSLIMNFAGVVCSFISLGIVILLLALAGVSLMEMQEHTLFAAAAQLLNALINVSVARLIYHKNWGFHIVPAEYRSRVQIRGVNAVLLAIITVVMVISIMITLLFKNNLEHYVITASLIFVITLPVLIYFLLQSDLKDGVDAENDL